MREVHYNLFGTCSLGIYYFSIFKMPVKVMEILESSRAKFLWGIDHDEIRIMWVKWKLILASKINGDLGVGNLVAFNQALLLK